MKLKLTSVAPENLKLSGDVIFKFCWRQKSVWSVIYALAYKSGYVQVKFVSMQCLFLDILTLPCLIVRRGRGGGVINSIFGQI